MRGALQRGDGGVTHVLARELIGIPSVSGDEKGVMEWVAGTPYRRAADTAYRALDGHDVDVVLDERLREETQMPAHLAESPLTCVAVGSGRSLEEFEVIHRTNKNSRGKPRRRF